MARSEPKRNAAWYWLLVVPFVTTLWPGLYDSMDPMLAGVPFFYWYQLLWIVLGAALTGVVYFATREPRRR